MFLICLDERHQAKQNCYISTFNCEVIMIWVDHVVDLRWTLGGHRDNNKVNTPQMSHLKSFDLFYRLIIE